MDAMGRYICRYYADAESKPPAIRAVMPGDEDYPYAHPNLGDAKEALLSVIRGRIEELRETARTVRALRVSDFRQEGQK